MIARHLNKIQLDHLIVHSVKVAVKSLSLCVSRGNSIICLDHMVWGCIVFQLVLFSQNTDKDKA